MEKTKKVGRAGSNIASGRGPGKDVIRGRDTITGDTIYRKSPEKAKRKAKNSVKGMINKNEATKSSGKSRYEKLMDLYGIPSNSSQRRVGY